MKNRIAALLIGAGMMAMTAEAQTTGHGPEGSFELGLEGMAWWFQDTPAPVPLVTNLIANSPATQTYLGGENLSVGTSFGGRIAGSYSLGDRLNLEGNFFFIPNSSTSKSVASSGQIGSQDLIVPYIDANTGQENGTEISFAPIYAGAAVEKYTVGMVGTEFNAALALSPSDTLTIDALGGVRYLNLHETYEFATSSPYIAPFPPGVWDTLDEFKTKNNFYGIQAGLRAQYDHGQFFGTGTVKFGLGAMVQSVDIRGQLVTDEFTSDGSTQTFVGGYFALPSNIGSYSRTKFAFVPEVDIRVGYRITPEASLVVGYSFVYASSVVRPGNQIDRIINTTQSTAYTEDPTPTPSGPVEPVLAFDDSSFWAQGASLGFAYRF